MKKWIAILIVLFLALGTYVAAGPYLTVRAIRRAVIAQDAAALAKQIDFPALRSSLKAQLDDRMVRSAGADMQASPLGAFGLTIAGAVAGTTVDAMVTPTGLGALMQGHILFKRFGDGLSSSEPSSPEPLHDPSYKYESTSRFIATTHDANDRPIVFVLTRHGLQWQLSDIQLPP
jgi:hypothetical protein